MTMLLLRQHYGRESNGVGPLTEFLIAFYAGVFFTKSATGPQCLLAFLVCTGIPLQVFFGPGHAAHRPDRTPIAARLPDLRILPGIVLGHGSCRRGQQ